MDRRRAAAALIALAACIACSSAAPTANDQTALELMEGPTEGCYYNFQHYGEGDRIMTNEPCLNCTCHNRMLMCYLRVCPFTKPIGQDCTVEKRADQCCPIVTCPDVPVDLLTSTSTSSPAEYGATGVGKLDKYGCSINGKYFSEGSKVPSTPNKPCEHCYCIRNMTTCVMQECTLHVDGCTPIYHKEVCCPVRYSCDHPEDEILLLDDMTTTVRPTPGFLLTTTTVMPVTQLSQDCVHDNQVFPDGTLIKTEKACEHCYCMKGDIVCVVQECGTPMENEGKNCTSLPPRHGQCCPDTYICEGDDRGTESTTEIVDQSTPPPRRVGVEGSGYRNEPDEPFTEMSPFETDIEGSGEDYTTAGLGPKIEDVITEKVTPDVIDEILFATTEKGETRQTTEPNKDLNTIPDIIISGEENSDQPDVMAQTTEVNAELATVNELKTTTSDEYKTVHGLFSKEDNVITTETAFRKEDNNIIADEMLTIKEQEKLPTTSVDLVDETTLMDEHLLDLSTESNLQSERQTTIQPIEIYTKDTEIKEEKETSSVDPSQSTATEKTKPDEQPATSAENIFTSITTVATDEKDIPETTSVNPIINEIDDNIPIISSPGRIPGEGDCLLNGITYTNNTIVPSTNNCHTSCKCTSSIIKCDPIICSSPPDYMENMNDCQPIYDSPDACCPTYVCSAKETIPPQSHNQMSGTESPKPIAPSECSGQACILDEEQKTVSELPGKCTTVDCLDKSSDKQEQGDCDLNNCGDQSQKHPTKQDCSDNKCQVLPVVACEGENCLTEPVTDIDSHKLPDSESTSQLICNENGECKKAEEDCKDAICEKHEISETEVKAPSDCTGSDCKLDGKPVLPPKEEQGMDLTTEQISTVKVTQISPTKLDVDAEYPGKTILPLTDDNTTENPTTEVVKHKEIEVTEKSTTVLETYTNFPNTNDDNDNTELPMTNDLAITEKSEIPITTEKSKTESHLIDEVMKTTERTVEQDTEISELPDSKDKVIEKTEADRITTESEMIYHVTTDSTKIKLDDKVTDKMEITTENVYSAVSESENEKMESGITESNEIEKSTIPSASPDVIEKDQTIEDVSELYGTQEEKTTSPVPIDVITEGKDITKIQFNEVTETYETPQYTNEPNKEIVEEKEKPTDIPALHKPQEEITDDNRDALDVTQSTELHETEDNTVTTDTIKNTDSNIVSTEASQPMQTESDDVTKNISQEIITENHETYTEPSEYITTKSEQTSSELSKQHENTQSTTQYNSQVTEQPITEKETTFTENSETLVTKSDENIHDIVQAITESEETLAETTDQLIEKLDTTSVTPITETKTETKDEEKEFTEIIESDRTEKQETYTEDPKIQTTSFEDLITKDYEINQSSSTKLPTMISTLAEDTISTIKITEEQDILTKATEKPVIEKDSHVTDEVSYPKTEIIETSTAEIAESVTEKVDVFETESTPAQTITENEIFIQPTSSEPVKDNEEEFESHKLETTLQDNLITQGLTTQEVLAVTESQTKSPIESNEKPHVTLTEKLPSEVDDNIEETTTKQLPQEKDESLVTPSAYSPSQNEHTTKQVVTESQETITEVTKDSQTQVDSSTKTSLFEDKEEEPTDISKPNRETLGEISTTSPHDEQKKEKDSTLLTDPGTSLEDMEKTTVSSMQAEEKATELPSHVTEGLTIAKDHDTDKYTTGVAIDEQLYETTENTVAEEEPLPLSTEKYAPVEDFVKETTLHSSDDVSTEKTKLQDTFETGSPTALDTTKSDMLTKFEESSTTESTLDNQEKERVTELPDSYVTFNDLDTTPIQKDQLDETNQSPGSEVDNLTTSATIQQEDDKTVTKTPIALVTDIDREKETSISEMELTTKTYDEKTLEEEKRQTLIPDFYTTEQQILTTEISQDIGSQHNTISTQKITTTESPEYFSTFQVHETTLSSLREVEKGDQQETTTEKVLNESDIAIDLHPTPPELEIQNTERTILSTKEDGIFKTEEEKTTIKPFVDMEKDTSYPPEHQTTVLISKEDITTELSRDETSTIPSKRLDQENIDFAVTEIHSTTEKEPLTKHPEEHHIEMVTEKEDSLESFDAESHVITTIKPTVVDGEEIQGDTVTQAATEKNLTDKPTATVTDEKESDIAEQENESTEIPVYTEIYTSTISSKVTEKQEITETESLTEKIETTKTETVDQKDSSTESSEEITREPEQTATAFEKITTTVPNDIDSSTTHEFYTKQSQPTDASYHTEPTTLITDNQVQLDKQDEIITSIPEDTSINIESTKPTIAEKETTEQSKIYSTQSAVDLQTEEPITQKETNKIEPEIFPTPLPNVNIATETSPEKHEEPSVIEDNKQTTDSSIKLSETTSFLVELEEHTHSVLDEITTRASLEEIATTQHYEPQSPERGDQIPDDVNLPDKEYQTSEPSKTTEEILEETEKPATNIEEVIDENIKTTNMPIKTETDISLVTEKISTSTSTNESVETKKETTIHDEEIVTSTSQIIKENDFTTESIKIQQTVSTTLPDVQTSTDKDIESEKPLKPEIFEEKETSEFAKDTTSNISEETSTYSPSHITKPKDKPSDTTLAPAMPELPKPGFIDENNEGIPSPDFPPTGGYGQEPDYIDEDQAFGPGTCRYGGKVYVSAQQIPRDDPCDFCFCFRSDIICLQQSCPPPIHGCHEEPIQGFCCPRYECPVSMATTLNVTTTTTTTTTTLPPHFLPHAYKGAAQRRGCQIKGHTYKVGEVVRASSGPCLHCTCGGDGQMKCDPKACTPEPMLRQMIAAAVSAKRRR